MNMTVTLGPNTSFLVGSQNRNSLSHSCMVVYQRAYTSYQLFIAHKISARSQFYLFALVQSNISERQAIFIFFSLSRSIC